MQQMQKQPLGISQTSTLLAVLQPLFPPENFLVPLGIPITVIETSATYPCFAFRTLVIVATGIAYFSCAFRASVYTFPYCALFAFRVFLYPSLPLAHPFPLCRFFDIISGLPFFDFISGQLYAFAMAFLARVNHVTPQQRCVNHKVEHREKLIGRRRINI